MIKKIFAGVCAFMLLVLLPSCKTEDNNFPETSTRSTTVMETRIYNYFKDVVPEFKFKNDPTEEYNEGISYVLRVEASEKEVKKFLKELKDAGFSESSVESEKYYAARNTDGYHVELTHIDGIMTLYVRKM